ncbi:MAG: EamA family transporter [Euryarchaeota archaeon]|nr:EamA family transporter [Euryarchaeota archaeon]
MRLHPAAYAVLSAVLFGLSPPLAKVLVRDLHPVALAGYLYLGAFLGLLVCTVLYRRGLSTRLSRGDLPLLAGAVLAGGVAAPVLMMKGLSVVSGFVASLLLNLESVATALIAMALFREHASRRFWAALGLICGGGVFLSWSPEGGAFELTGAVLIVLAMLLWGVDNNLTGLISDRDPVFIAMTKGLAGGAISLGIGAYLGVLSPPGGGVVLALLLGALSYGASLLLFIVALQRLGAARTGAYFSVAPFVGAAASLVILRESPGWAVLPAVLAMAAGVLLLVGERHEHPHRHARTVHEHFHSHDDGHHLHPHESRYHCHPHVHEELVHSHPHCPDTHHRHCH